MWILMLEAFGALSLLVFIVWWTMFSGREPGPRKPGASRTENGKENDTPGT